MKIRIKTREEMNLRSNWDRPLFWNQDGHMDHLYGKVVEGRRSDYNPMSYRIEDGDNIWYVYVDDVEIVNEKIQ